jgi:hypothetical protein
MQHHHEQLDLLWRKEVVVGCTCVMAQRASYKRHITKRKLPEICI